MTSLRASALLPSHQPRATAASSRLQHLGRQRPCSRVGAHRPPTTRVEARRRGSLDASIDEVIDACSSLERLYAGSDGRPAVDSPQTLAAQQQQDAKRASRGSMDDMACGKAICVEQREAAAAAAVEAAASDARAADFGGGASGSLGRLLEWLPFSPRTQGILMLNLLVLLVATNWVVVKDVGNSFDPFGFAFLRFAVAAAAFSPFMPAAFKDKRIMRAGLELGVWFAAGYITQSAGLLTTDASRASFLSTFTVLVVPLLAGISGRGVSLVTWAACFAALLGVGLLEQNGAPPGVGDIWSFLSAVAFGVQVFRTEHWARILGNGANLSLMSIVLTSTMVFSGAAAAFTHTDLVAGLMQNPGGLGEMLTSGSVPWWQVMYCGLLTTDLALLLEVLALQNVSSVDAAIIYTLEPVTGAGLAWLVLGERLGPLGLAGAGIILASSVASQLLGGEPAPPAVAAALASASDVEGSVDAELLPAKPKSKKSE